MVHRKRTCFFITHCKHRETAKETAPLGLLHLEMAYIEQANRKVSVCGIQQIVR
jgi:hypothetical protein